MATRANLRTLKRIQSNPELLRAVMELPDGESRELAIARACFLFPWTRESRRRRARDFLQDHLDSFIDFGAVPRIFFELPRSNRSLEDYQDAVSRALPSVRKSYREALKDFQDLAAQSLGQKRLAGDGKNPSERLTEFHSTLLELFEAQFGVFSRRDLWSVATSKLLGAHRSASPREIEEINSALVEELLKEGIGARLKEMVLTNSAIQAVYQGERNRSTTSTNYFVPHPDYWRWPLGSPTPIRVNGLSEVDLSRARGLRSQMDRTRISPWAGVA